MLQYRFPFWYQPLINEADHYDLEVKVDGKIQTIQLQGVSKDVFPTWKELERSEGEQLQFEINDNIGFPKNTDHLPNQ